MKIIVEGHHTLLTPRRWRAAVILLVAALISAPVLAQRQAQPRSGSSGGGGSSSGGHRASGGSSGGSHSSSASRPSGSSSRSSGSSAHRGGSSGPHRPPGVDRSRGSHHGHHYPYYGHNYYPRYGFSFGYYSPYYYSPYYYPYYGYSPYYYGYYGRPYGYGYYAPRGGYPPYGGEPSYADRRDLGAVALKVRPKTAEVYVDGRYVGAAGSFDGFPSYLWLEPGSYRLELVQDGYENLERAIEVSPGQVLEFKLRLDQGVASRPEPRSDERYDDREGRRPYPPPGDYDRRGGDEMERGSEPPRDARRDAAELVLDVEPDDASVYVDGRFVGTGREVSTATEPLVVEAGEHRVEVVHPRFESEERTVTVRPGEERLVEVALRRGGV